jgi:hypothetical protein
MRYGILERLKHNAEFSNALQDWNTDSGLIWSALARLRFGTGPAMAGPPHSKIGYYRNALPEFPRCLTIDTHVINKPEGGKQGT